MPGNMLSFIISYVNFDFEGVNIRILIIKNKKIL